MPSSPLLSSLAHVVRSLRTARGLTQASLARTARLSPRFIADLEAGRANISLLKLSAVAAALSTTIAHLVVDAEQGTKGGAPLRILPRSVALVGLRGAGKSTIGKAAAQRLGVVFVELDRVVEERAALSLQNIFDIHGDAYFRKMEAEALVQVLGGKEPCVIATGGSLVMHEKSWATLRKQTTTIWLRSTPEDHYARVQAQGDLRPMSGRPQAMTELRRLLTAREPHYKRADHTVDTSKHTIAESVERLVELSTRAPT